MSGLFGVATSSRPGLATPADDNVHRIADALRLHAYDRTDVTSLASGLAIGQLRRDGAGAPAAPWRHPAGVWMWLAGECYRATGEPIDQIAHVYDHVDATDPVQRLTATDGMFQVAVWNEQTATLQIINDRHGLVPCYYACINGTLIFAPRIRPLLLPWVPRTLDAIAVAEYARYQQLLGERTWIEGIRLLPAASVLTFDTRRGTLDTRRYWDWDRIAVRPSTSFADAVATTADLERRAILRRLDGHSRTGVYLSGGLDSRRILAVAAAQTPVTTISYGARGCRDVVLAARIARRAGAAHHWHPFVDGRWVIDAAPDHLALTEGQHSWVHAHGMSTLADARERIDVNLSGWAGGSPYFWILMGRALSAFALADPAGRARSVHETFSQQLTWPGLTDPEATGLLRQCGGGDLNALALASMASHVDASATDDPARRLMFINARHHDRRLTLNFVTFTRSAVGVRCPFIDREFIDYVYALPDAVLLHPQFHHAVTTRLAPRLTTIPRDRDWRLPHPSPWVRTPHALWRRGLGWLGRHGVDLTTPHATLYADYENYLRHELRPWAERLLFDERTLARGFYDVAALRALWQRHLDGRELHTIGKLAPLMAIEMALRYLVDGDTPAAACALDGKGHLSP